MIENITGGHKTKAMVVGDVLVLSFPDANTPSVWRASLTEAQGCFFEIESDDVAQLFHLVQKKGKTKEVITTFNSRARAMNALIKATQALHKASKKCHITGDSKGGKGFPWGKILLLAVAIFIIFSFLNSVGRQGYIPSQVQQTSGTNTPQTQQTPINSENAPSGVPVSADDFLGE